MGKVLTVEELSHMRQLFREFTKVNSSSKVEKDKLCASLEFFTGGDTWYCKDKYVYRALPDKHNLFRSPYRPSFDTYLDKFFPLSLKKKLYKNSREILIMEDDYPDFYHYLERMYNIVHQPT